ncbi:MAG TPA: hypothetical protein PLL47_12620, partial [Methanosarcina sp.]|nr:hypothetical protein [Methanosarcina sp.]
ISCTFSVPSSGIIPDSLFTGFKTDEPEHSIPELDETFSKNGESEIPCSNPADSSSPCTTKLVEKRRPVKTAANVKRYNIFAVQFPRHTPPDIAYVTSQGCKQDTGICEVIPEAIP